MPLLPSSHKAPFYLFNGHLQTIVPSLFRQVAGVQYQRERVVTPDALSMLWYIRPSGSLAVRAVQWQRVSETVSCGSCSYELAIRYRAARPPDARV